MHLDYPEVSDDVFDVHYHKYDHAQARRIFRFVMWVSIPLLYIDFSILGLGISFFAMAAARTAVWVYAAWTLRSTGRSSEPSALDKHLYRWAILVLVVQLASNVLSPVNYLGHFLIDAWICLIASIVVPLKVNLLRPLVIAFFVASLALCLTKVFPSHSYQFTVVAVLLVSTYTGQAVSAYIMRFRRKLLSAELELQRKENTDALTGIANRREFIRVIDNELQRHHRLGKPMSLMVVDLDHLKEINIAYGSGTGDMVLVEVSKRMKRATRTYDLLARYGTEEFSVLLPEAGEETALKIAARARSTILAMPIAASGKELKVTATIGVATIREGDTIESILRRAEDALLKAKKEEMQSTDMSAMNVFA